MQVSAAYGFLAWLLDLREVIPDIIRTVHTCSTGSVAFAYNIEWLAHLLGLLAFGAYPKREHVSVHCRLSSVAPS